MSRVLPRLLACAESLGTQYKRPAGAQRNGRGILCSVSYARSDFAQEPSADTLFLYIHSGKPRQTRPAEDLYIRLSLALVTLSRGLPNLRLHLYPSRSHPSHRLPMQQEKMSSQNNLQDSAAPRPAEAQPAVNSTPMPSTSGSDDTLLCKWKQCGERADTAESLFVSLVPPSPRKP